MIKHHIIKYERKSFSTVFSLSWSLLLSSSADCISVTSCWTLVRVLPIVATLYRERERGMRWHETMWWHVWCVWRNQTFWSSSTALGRAMRSAADLMFVFRWLTAESIALSYTRKTSTSIQRHTTHDLHNKCFPDDNNARMKRHYRGFMFNI